MYNTGISRRDWLRSSLAASGGALAGASALAGVAKAEPGEKPSSLAITAVETFSLSHKLARFVRAVDGDVAVSHGAAGQAQHR